ncbi:unnamed protein product [Adineta steineri]|uniref:Uncharacterized protein n=1 Tax=Adineta steineri TaxID=433720 RepID=A0A815Q5U3_9BILA|nr:unnamed protein product [Adineta steineri]CAF4025809.1 unnamed protein product [Adineta steineri]
MRHIFTFIIFLTTTLVVVETTETVHNTDYLSNAQYFDCLHYTNEYTHTYSIKYCVQPENITNTQKQNHRNKQTQCDKGTTAHSFTSLFENDIDPYTVLSTFRSGVEQADRYGSYYFSRQLNNSSVLIDNDSICNCSSLKGVFGRYCEYEFYVGSTLAETTRIIKIKRKPDALYGQLQRRRMCYTEIDCNYGVLCLDWRNICDGTQNCMDGVDEENCDRIEMNECLKNEFRCRNGLCIPEEYWLDGEVDCQDTSDELEPVDLDINCPLEKGMDCDERVCWNHESISCGDGICVLPYRLILNIADMSNDKGLTAQCYTLRDIAFQCEIHRPFRLWTLSGGFCTHLKLPWGDELFTSEEGACEFRLKCHLSSNLSANCLMDDRKFMWLESLCTSYTHVSYPRDSLLGPFFDTYYPTKLHLYNSVFPSLIHVHGGLRCAGFHVTFIEFSMLENLEGAESLYFAEASRMEERLCRFAAKTNPQQSFVRNHSNLAPHFNTSCWHKWLAFFDLSNVEEVAAECNEYCLSPHRISDGLSDCLGRYRNVSAGISVSLDERSIGGPFELYHKSCLNCIGSRTQNPICLPVSYIDSFQPHCMDGKERYLIGTEIAIKSLKCDGKDASECHIIRDYVIQSFIDEKNITITTTTSSFIKVLPFIQHCDTYFDTETGIDESVEHCLDKWSCAANEYRCLTGQCIPLDWICDGKVKIFTAIVIFTGLCLGTWDCSDASDEQGLLHQVGGFIDNHNRLLLNFKEVWMRCFERYENQSFANICNITTEYPCFLANVDNPLDFQLNRPCIELKRIGDRHIDCLGKSDERNLIKCGTDVLGWQFGCTNTNTECIIPRYFCTSLFTCPVHDKRMACFYKDELNCNEYNDVMCLNGTCLRNARCNGEWDCLNGEDEYWCQSNLDGSEEGLKIYRNSRRIELISKITLTDYINPSTNRKYRQLSTRSVHDGIQQIFMKSYLKQRTQNVDDTISDDAIAEHYLEQLSLNLDNVLNFILPFICNRGIPINFINKHTRCLCSPSYYGDYCEFHANRISLVTHLNLTNYNGNYTTLIAKNGTILVSCTFRYKERIIDRHEFYIYSILKRTKQKFYFAYPRTAEFQEQKRNERNGTGLYSIRFEAFYLQPESYPVMFGIWHFPIEFDFLPAFRFAKILRFNNITRNYVCNLECGSHGTCLHVENEIEQFICSCHSGWYSNRCDQYYKECENYCHPHAICRPQERGFINGDIRPACLCPYGHFGPTCHLTYPSCTQCENGGSCYLTYDSSHIRPFECICIDNFYGDYCQFLKPSAVLRISEISSSFNILATSVQYYDVQIDLHDLYISKQQVFLGQLIEAQIDYVKNSAPSVIIIKLYNEDHLVYGPIFYLVYSQQNPKVSNNMTVQLTNENECKHTHVLFDSKIIQNTRASVLVFKYHELCRYHRQNRSSIVCFRDDDYFCLCDMTKQRAQCLRFDPYSDNCQYCLSGGKCIRGNLKQEQDFICLCPRCTYGRVCQFSTQLFSFTLDSLMIKDVQAHKNLSITVYMMITSLTFLTGIFSNLCSLLVFSRKNPRKVGVGYYLFLVSIMNIVSLIFQYGKIIHILLGGSGLLLDNKINLILCKLLSPMTSITTRISYWLTSLVTTERLSSVLYPTQSKIRKLNITFLLSLITILILCGTHIHEFLFYKIIRADSQQTNSNSLICVIDFVNQNWLMYNRINVLIHHLIPFSIQFMSITLMIIRIAKTRARINQDSQKHFFEILRKQFKTQKELYITPAVIIIAALPQLIFSSSFACTELNNDWQRYTLLLAYLFSFIPQICSFLIFVLPSTSYKTEFAKTRIDSGSAKLKDGDDAKYIRSDSEDVTHYE